MNHFCSIHPHYNPCCEECKQRRRDNQRLLDTVTALNRIPVTAANQAHPLPFVPGHTEEDSTPVVFVPVQSYYGDSVATDTPADVPDFSGGGGDGGGGGASGSW